MAEYVEKKMLKAFIDNLAYETGQNNGFITFKKEHLNKVLDRMTVDAEEVVRCKNCKHSYYDSELEKYWCTNYSGSIEKSADGFCDDGKPRSE